MALMTPQAITGMHTVTYSQPTTSDTITPDTGLILDVVIGATSTTVTMVVPGNQPYTGTAIADQSTGAVTNTRRHFAITRDLIGANGLVTVTYSQVTNVTAALLKAPQR
ncbi:MAG: hypothetical protein ACREF4_10575 [Gammaproteobacteria bacterium]